MGSLPHKDYLWHTEHRGKQCMFMALEGGARVHVDVCVCDGDIERQRKAECAFRKIPSGVSSACRDEA